MIPNDTSARVPGSPDGPVWQPALPEDLAAAPADANPQDAAAWPAASPTGEAESGAGPIDARGELLAGRARRTRAPARRPRSTTILLLVSSLVAVGGIGFAIGHATSAASSAANQVNAGNGFAGGQLGPGGSFDPGRFAANASGAPDFAGGRGGGVAGSGTITGTVVSVGTDSITIQLASGQTVTVATGSSTTYHSQASGSSSDVTTGATVVVQTTTGSNAAASASPGTTTNRTATDVTVTSN